MLQFEIKVMAAVTMMMAVQLYMVYGHGILYMVWPTLPQCFNSPAAQQPHRTVTRRKRKKQTCDFSLTDPKSTKMVELNHFWQAYNVIHRF